MRAYEYYRDLDDCYGESYTTVQYDLLSETRETNVPCEKSPSDVKHENFAREHNPMRSRPKRSPNSATNNVFSPGQHRLCQLEYRVLLRPQPMQPNSTGRRDPSD